MKSKDGITSLYGNTESSRLQYNNSYVLSWQISRIQDLNGNYIRYDYYRVSNDGNLENCLSQIAYTGGTTLAPHYTVSFEYYDSLIPPRTTYVETAPSGPGLLKMKKSRLLKKIMIKSGYQELYTYNFYYDCTSGMEPRLNYVMKEAANEDYYASNVITWNSPNMVTTNDSLSMGASKKNNFLHADFTGNGKTDILSYSSDSHTLVLYKNTSNGSVASFTSLTIDLSNISSDCKFISLTPLDYNGDGKMDIAGVYKVGLNYHARCLLSTGNGFTDSGIHKHSTKQKEVIAGDFDGDGRDELIFTHEPDVMYDYVENYVERAVVISNLPTSGFLSPSIVRDKCKLTLDFNGNGRTEILFGDADGFSTYELQTSNSTIFHEIKSVTRAELNIALDLDYDKLLFADFNADGRTDFIYYGYDSNPNDGMFETRLYAATASSFELVRTDLFPSTPVKAFAADCNGDDLPDLIYTFGSSSVGCRVGLNTGNSFTTLSFTWNGMVPADITGENGLAFTDITGDGRADLFCFKDGTSNAKVRQIYNGSHHLVSSVQDGFGNIHQFTYKPLTNSSVYSVSSTLSITFPYNTFRQPMTVVSAYSAPYVNRTFNYEDAIIHRQGKGFLGFKKMTVLDNLNILKTISSKKLNTTYAYLIPFQTETKTLAGSPISTVVFTDSLFVYDINKKRVWPFIKETVETDNLTSLNTIKLNRYYADGNVKESKTTKGSLVITQKFKYSTVANWWCSNRVSEQTETRKLGSEQSAELKTKYYYNEKGNVIRVVENQDSLLCLTHVLSYDPFGHVSSETITGSGQTRTTSTVWLWHGRYPSSSTDELGVQTTYHYNDINQLVSVDCPNSSNTTSYEYDAFGRLTKTILPDGTVKETTYAWITGSSDVKYSITESASQAPPVTTYYNAAGKPLLRKTIGFNSKQVFTAYGYNANGSTSYVSEPFFATGWSEALARTFDADSATLYTYDVYGRTASVLSPTDSLVYSYNGLITKTVSRELTDSTIMDNTGMVIRRTMLDESLLPPSIEPLRVNPGMDPIEAPSRSIRYTYYPTGQVKTIKPDGGGTITLAYDLHGNRTLLIDPDAGTITDTYNAFDQPVTHQQNVNNVNITTTYTYASNGLLNSETTNGPESSTKRYFYDNIYFKNLPTKISYGNNTQTLYAYDTYGRLTATNQTVGGVTTTDTYAYGSYSLPTSHIHDAVATENYVYDTNGYQTKERLGNTDVWQLLSTNARGQVLQEKKSGITTTYTYDKAGRILSIYAPNIIHLLYEYDASGNMVSKTDGITHQKTTYGYDHKERLTDWRVQSPVPVPMRGMAVDPINFIDTTFTMTYDGVTGNILTKSDLGTNASFNYTPTAKPHALTGISNVTDGLMADPVAVTYTDRGKVKTVSLGSGAASYAISYAAQGGRGKSVLTVGNHTQTRYYGDGTEKVYDSFGLLRKLAYLCHGAIVVNDEVIPADRSADTSDIDDEGLTDVLPASLRSESGILSSPPSGTILQGYYDAQGSLTALVSSDGTLLRRYAYDPWGNRLDPDDWTLPDTQADTYHINRGYTMHEHLGDFGLINMNGRVFDPLTAQFLSPDNYIQADGNWLNYNRYAYCLNNPLKYTDPSGEIVWETILLAAWIGGMVNIASNAKNINSFGAFWGSFAVGALAGAASACIGAGMASVIQGGSFLSGITSTAEIISPSGFVNGFCVSGTTGAGSGLITGVGNAVLSNSSPDDVLLQGAIGALGGGLIGGIIGGVCAGFDAKANGGDFWKGTFSEEIVYDVPINEVQVKNGRCIEGAMKAHGVELNENTWNRIYNESITPGNEYPDIGIYEQLLNDETTLDIRGWPIKNSSVLKSSEVVTNGNRYVLFQNNAGTNVKHALALKSIAHRTFNNGFFRNTSYYRYCTYNPTSGGYRCFHGSSFFDAAYIFKTCWMN